MCSRVKTAGALRTWRRNFAASSAVMRPHTVARVDCFLPMIEPHSFGVIEPRCYAEGQIRKVDTNADTVGSLIV